MQRFYSVGCGRKGAGSVFAIAILCSLASCSQNEIATIEYIVFSSDRTGTGDLYIMNPDGTGVKQIPALEGFKKEPCLSRDGLIVYQTGGRYIRRVDMDGSNDVSLNAAGHDAEWSPDGKYIIFTDHDWDILRMDRNGENIVNLTDSADSTDFWPTWSPSGQEILWQSNGNLWLMNADGSGKRMILGEKGYGRAELSPDGRRIAYTRITGQRRCLFIMDSDGTNIRQLTMEDAEGYGDSEVTWSPNGKRLLFMRLFVVSYSDAGYPDFQCDLCTLDLKSGTVTHLTTGPENDFCPSWKRVRSTSGGSNNIVSY